MSFGTDYQSIFLMSTRLLEDNIYGVRFPQFQNVHIHDTKRPSHKKLVKFCCDVHYMW